MYRQYIMSGDTKRTRTIASATSVDASSHSQADGSADLIDHAVNAS